MTENRGFWGSPRGSKRGSKSGEGAPRGLLIPIPLVYFLDGVKGGGRKGG